METPASVQQPGAREDCRFAIDIQFDVGGGHVVEADSAELHVRLAVGESQEWFAGEKRRQVHCFFRDGEDGRVGLRVDDICFS